MLWAACEKDATGGISFRRDCSKFLKVGDVLMTVPLSMPAKSEYVAAMSYFVRNAKSDGAYDKILQQVDKMK